MNIDVTKPQLSFETHFDVMNINLELYVQ